MSDIFVKCSTHKHFFLTDPPNILSSFNDTIKNATNTLTLSCSFEGIPTPQVYWYVTPSSTEKRQRLRNSGRIVVNHEVDENGNSFSELLIYDLRKIDEGNYQCIGSNGVENLIGAVDNHEGFVTIYGKVDCIIMHFKSTCVVNLIHVVPPSIFPSGDDYTIAGVKDSNFSIIFIIEDDYPPVQLSNIHWHFTNLSNITTEIEPSAHYTFSSDLKVLEIHNVQLADRGNYSLTASNEAGIRSSEIQMDVYGE